METSRGGSGGELDPSFEGVGWGGYDNQVLCQDAARDTSLPGPETRAAGDAESEGLGFP